MMNSGTASPGLPAAGPAGAGGPTAGAHFGDPSVDPLTTGNPLDLLGAETFDRTADDPNDQVPNPTPITPVAASGTILHGEPSGE